MKKILFTLFITILATTLSIIALSTFVKGGLQYPLYFQTHNDPITGGPFEQSISAARYALTESIVDNHSLLLSYDLAKFSSPDIVLYKGKFFSVFTPGISFLGVPFYIVGKLLGLQQLFTYFSILFVSIINVFLIALIVKKLGAKFITGIFAGLIFLFGTNALSYAFTFTQHPVSTMLVLLGLLNAFGKRTFLKDFLLGALIGIGPIIDVPNIFLLAPIVLYIVYKHFELSEQRNRIVLSLKTSIIGLLIGILPFIALFGWYNYETAGSVTKIAQLIGNTNYFDKLSPTYKQSTSVPTLSNTPAAIGIHLPFLTRNELNGFYTLLISNERAWIFYCPVVFVGLLGLWIARKTKHKEIALVGFAVILVDIVLYSTFGDPWGGWNFGPRYLIPAASVLCVYLGLAIEKYKRNILFILVLTVSTIYSVYINAMGALTTISIPPKVEAVALLHPVPYTYAYNQQLIASNFTYSLVYNSLFIQSWNVSTFLYLVIYLICLALLFTYILVVIKKGDLYAE